MEASIILVIIYKVWNMSGLLKVRLVFVFFPEQRNGIALPDFYNMKQNYPPLNSESMKIA